MLCVQIVTHLEDSQYSLNGTLDNIQHQHISMRC